eukprot:CAMPEP_0175963266 /NCGR_PEP_ID=MMETSP0108-20121206/36926_1 /TAXON_ID=195067 ORGANISM="Goniomonas pacifica, Strain CCMP1869" /NCGR_SAMPLE_ID=MMETSP0108 /ASSEMBLY_ACC=CAM_ASM_000204 /LENGTH=157 /DNA_ID=CAMNT_0017291149 /DNA_START=99 /DNA_END=573 /DNA_ORIENTATION=-
MVTIVMKAITQFVQLWSVLFCKSQNGLVCGVSHQAATGEKNQFRGLKEEEPEEFVFFFDSSSEEEEEQTQTCVRCANLLRVKPPTRRRSLIMVRRTSLAKQCLFCKGELRDNDRDVVEYLRRQGVSTASNSFCPGCSTPEQCKWCGEDFSGLTKAAK